MQSVEFLGILKMYSSNIVLLRSSAATVSFTLQYYTTSSSYTLIGYSLTCTPTVAKTPTFLQEIELIRQFITCRHTVITTPLALRLFLTHFQFSVHRQLPLLHTDTRMHVHTHAPEFCVCCWRLSIVRTPYVKHHKSNYFMQRSRRVGSQQQHEVQSCSFNVGAGQERLRGKSQAKKQPDWSTKQPCRRTTTHTTLISEG